MGTGFIELDSDQFYQGVPNKLVTGLTAAYRLIRWMKEVKLNIFLMSPFTHKVVPLIFPSLRCLTFTVQNDVCAEFDTKRLFLDWCSEEGKVSSLSLTPRCVCYARHILTVLVIRRISTLLCLHRLIFSNHLLLLKKSLLSLLIKKSAHSLSTWHTIGSFFPSEWLRERTL